MLNLNNRRKVSVNKVCRSCLTERGHLRDMFSTKIPKMLETIASVQIVEGDGLPPNICISCFHLIAKFHTFRLRLEKNDKFLRNICKVVEKDILDLAVSEAQISHENEIDQNDLREECDTTKTARKTSEGTPQEVNNIETKHHHENNEQHRNEKDTSSNKEMTCELEPFHYKRKSKEKAKKFIDELLKDDSSDLQANENDLKQSDSSGKELSKDNTLSDGVRKHTLPEGPPPLVPIKPETPKEQTEIDSGMVEQKLPDDAPPLVPIKALAKPDDISTNIKESSDLRLICSSCDEEFSSTEVLKQHKLHNCQISNMQCNICKKQFKDTKKLIGHLKGHMVVKDYGCKICDKRYPNPSTFKVHMRTHTGERPFKCEVCGKGFIRWAGVAGHMKTHQSHKPFKCPTCGKGFKISSNLERHKVLHSDILPYCCYYCGKTFSQLDNLQLHTRTHHTNERPYLCNECGKGFVSSTRLNRHMWVHTGYKPYQCKTCPKAYSNSNDLKNHERTHSGKINENDKPYACEVCEMRFYHPCRLNKHIKTHERPYACSSCPKKFTSTRWLNKHMESDHGNVVENDVQYIQEVEIDQVLIEYDSAQYKE